jgi:hypothetical protein
MTTCLDPYVAFRDDKCRLAALQSKHERDKSVARTWAAVFIVVGVALIVTGNHDTVLAWLAAAARHLPDDAPAKWRYGKPRPMVALQPSHATRGSVAICLGAVTDFDPREDKGNHAKEPRHADR